VSASIFVKAEAEVWPVGQIVWVSAKLTAGLCTLVARRSWLSGSNGFLHWISRQHAVYFYNPAAGTANS
jgi:hypothetical protein